MKKFGKVVLGLAACAVLAACRKPAGAPERREVTLAEAQEIYAGLTVTAPTSGTMTVVALEVTAVGETATQNKADFDAAVAEQLPAVGTVSAIEADYLSGYYLSAGWFGENCWEGATETEGWRLYATGNKLSYETFWFEQTAMWNGYDSANTLAFDFDEEGRCTSQTQVTQMIFAEGDYYEYTLAYTIALA